jgi:ATPase subunit of ABC transporter with duplicated ATPase domains
MAYLRQDQFAFEDQRVIDVVMMGHETCGPACSRRMRSTPTRTPPKTTTCTPPTWKARFAEYGGYTAESRAGELLLGVGIPAEQHFGPMSDVAPGWKLRVLLIQALFANPDILLLDEPTNNLDIAPSAGWRT